MNYVLMCGYLKNAVARSVDNREASGDVLDAQLLDDFGSRGWLVAKCPAANLTLKL